MLSTGRAKWRSDLHNNGLSETDETKNRKGDTSNAICHAENGPEISTVLRIAEEIRMFKLLFVSVFVMVLVLLVLSANGYGVSCCIS